MKRKTEYKMNRNTLLALAMCFLFAGYGNAQSTENRKSSFSLEEAQEFAIENNLNIENARLDVESAVQRVRENAAMGLPQINAGAQYTNNLQLMTQLILNKFPKLHMVLSAQI